MGEQRDVLAGDTVARVEGDALRVDGRGGGERAVWRAVEPVARGGVLQDELAVHAPVAVVGEAGVAHGAPAEVFHAAVRPAAGVDAGGRDQAPERSLSPRAVSQPQVCEERAAVTPGHQRVGRPQWSGGEVRGSAGEQRLLGQREAAEGRLHQEGETARVT